MNNNAIKTNSPLINEDINQSNNTIFINEIEDFKENLTNKVILFTIFCSMFLNGFDNDTKDYEIDENGYILIIEKAKKILPLFGQKQTYLINERAVSLAMEVMRHI